MSGPVHIIAEAGTNHGGSIDTAKALVDVAVASGADSVKFQLIHPEGLYVPALFSEGQLVKSEVFEQRRRAQLSDATYVELAGYARSLGIAMSASIFDEEGLDLLDAIDAPYIKIASCDLNNSHLLRQAAERGRTLIVSTGMSTLQEIESAVNDLSEVRKNQLVLMHCVSVYPCQTERMNLGFIDVLSRTFGFPVGLSDHTEESIAAVMAVSLGAEWIEKHFTLDRRSEGFDHAYAMEPSALSTFVRDVRVASAARAPRQEKLTAEEVVVRDRARRGLYASRNLAVGEKLSARDVRVVRPPGPLRPNDLPSLIGRSVTRPIRQFEPLSPDMFD